jgi:3-oxoacyl-[acyl-carrier-protein] synthase-3
VVHGKLDAPDRCACFDISLGCSGYVYGLAVVGSLMETTGMETGLLFTADPYSKIVDEHDRNTALLFGDAATVTLLRRSNDVSKVWVPRRFAFGTRGQAGSALQNRGGRLAMDGRAIFNFSLTEVPQQVRECLAAAGLERDDVDLFLFHQGSRFIVDNLVKRLGLAPTKVPIDIADCGNTVSSSIPLLLERHGMPAGPSRIVMSGFGVGLSWATCVLTREP